MASVSVDGSSLYDISFNYDADGIRISKNADGTHHYYLTQNGRVIRERIGIGSTAKVLDFIYDESGKPCALIYTNGTATPLTYYYVLNLQGDVVGLVNANGESKANYTYNAWGEVLTATGTMAAINPLRYRGYYYDTETGFYYLQSRYYDPVTHRFINADSYTSTGAGILGTNMFAYCNNNPVNMIDPTGAIAQLVSNVITEIAQDVVTDIVSHIERVHVTTPELMIDFGPLFGQIGFSTTTTKQNKESGLFYSYSDIGNDCRTYGIGCNIAGWLGGEIGVSSTVNVFANVQITPWIHGEISVGLDGVGITLGVIDDETTYDFEVKVGLGWLIFFFAPEVAPFSDAFATG